MIVIEILDARLRAAGIPIVGVADNGNGGTYRVDFAVGATPAQRGDAAVIVAAFDPVAEQGILDGLAAGKIAAQSEAETWFAANPGALALFNLPLATLEAEANTLVDALFPSATSPNKTKLKRLLMAGAVLDRSQVKKDGLG